MYMLTGSQSAGIPAGTVLWTEIYGIEEPSNGKVTTYHGVHLTLRADDANAASVNAKIQVYNTVTAVWDDLQTINAALVAGGQVHADYWATKAKWRIVAQSAEEARVFVSLEWPYDSSAPGFWAA